MGSALQGKRALEAGMVQGGEGIAYENPNWREELTAAGILSTTTEKLPSADAGEVSYTDAAFSELLGSYIALKQSDLYTNESAVRVAESVAAAVQPPLSFTPVTSADVRVSSSVSRAEYKAALARITSTKLAFDEPEFLPYAKYVETGDSAYLETLRSYGVRYKEAAEQALALGVPPDARDAHADFVNALLRYGASLDALARFADDPVAGIALLRGYNDAERDVFSAFSRLSIYFTGV